MNLGKIVLETDSPYLRLPLMRRDQPTPFFTFHVANRVAEIKNVPSILVAAITTRTANLFYE